MKAQPIFLMAAIVAAFVGGIAVRGLFTMSSDDRQESKTAGGASPEAAVYTCSMHPQIRQPQKGKCPICAMDLVLVEVGGGAEGGGRELKMSPRARKLAEVESAVVERKFVTAEIRMVGKVTYDESRISYITSWVPGRLDRLYVDYTGVPVEKGDHLVYMYSPELLQAQEELISALATSTDLRESRSDYLKGRVGVSVESAREKLRLWGLSDSQIEEIERCGTPNERVTINSPISGVVVHKNAIEGMYVQTGTHIYTIADLSELWVKLDAYESDLAWLHYGQEVEFRTEAYPGEVFRGQIALIDPILNPKTRTVKIRVNLPNPGGRLKPDMFVRAVVKSRTAEGGQVVDADLAGKWISPMHPEIIKDAPGECDICGMALVSAESLGYVATEEGSAPLAIPASAPLITGKRAVVYVDKGEGRYEGREIELGPRAGDYYLVESGLEEGERVVVKGNFKIDSAIQILAKPSMMNPEGDRGSGAYGGEHITKSYSVPEVFKRQLNGVVRAYVNVKDRLSHDRFAECQELIPSLRGALESVDISLVSGEAHHVWMTERSQLMQGMDAVAGADQLAGARKGFDLVSNALIDVVRQFGASGDQPVLLYHCPMAFGGRGASWLQNTEGTENPYYGSQMFQCGRLKEMLVPGSQAGGHEGQAHE
ncbi:MAG: Cation efflux system protein CusB [Verrucomicrobia subdivision 3 bacterium]|nr:Cation efflux system protein CusB [Limisphaerales bacterium]MCS1416508.1 Cation efflux system protein CusB [Limisphaerales bacterium]